jgi:solute carrier family 8 (sodium/calcium exchanger)
LQQPSVQQQAFQSAYAEEKAVSAGLAQEPDTRAPEVVQTYEPQIEKIGKADFIPESGVAPEVEKPPPELELGPAQNMQPYQLQPVEEPPQFMESNQMIPAPMPPPVVQPPPPQPAVNKGPDLKEPEPEETVEYNAAYEFKKAVAMDCIMFLIIAGGLIFIFAQKSAHTPKTCIDEDILKSQNKDVPKSCEECGSGTIVIPLGGEWEKSWPKPLRAVLYFMGLGWCFLGIAIVCDQFMAAIEMITSKEKVVWLKVHGDTKHKFHKKVWNDTVANLTLMALGSSAPEILLSVIELMGNSFFAGELGPSTIVGSAAFNLLVITAVCVAAIPAPEVRKIDGLSVFVVTASLSVFAYVWLIIILQIMTPDVVTKGEAITTFAFFPMLVILAFMADKGLCGHGRKSHGKDIEVEKEKNRLEGLYGKKISFETVKMMIEECKGPQAPPKTKAQYRKEFLKNLVGGGKDTSAPAITLGFAQQKYMCLECAGNLEVKVKLSQRIDTPMEVRYYTQDGLALAGKRYEHVEGILKFQPGEQEQPINVPIIDNEVWEEQEDFMICLDGLSGPAAAAQQQGWISGGLGPVGYGCGQTRVIILNDDEPGTLCFFVDEVQASRGGESVQVNVNRINGSTGKISCKFQTVDDTALAGTHYTASSGPLTFEDGQTKASMTIGVSPSLNLVKDKRFRIKLTEPSEGVRFDAERDGGVECAISEVTLPGSNNRAAIAKILACDCKFQQSLPDWKAQFSNALYCNGSAADQSTSTRADWVFHLASIFWKFLFALVPPAGMCGGWACFCSALGMIGLVTMIVGDMAALMGCCMGIADDITAITIVALGTSLPDTFASKSAAAHDPNADNSIGNVTGSNCVNVFLGLGLPWTAGAFYWDSIGKSSDWIKKDFKGDNYEKTWGTKCPNGCFLVPAGALSFSVTVFTFTALSCIALLFYRRTAYGGELGGPSFAAKRDSGILVGLWFVYIISSILKSTGVL